MRLGIPPTTVGPAALGPLPAAMWPWQEQPASRRRSCAAWNLRRPYTVPRPPSYTEAKTQ